MRQNSYGKVSDETLRIRKLMDAVTSIGLDDNASIDACQSLLEHIYKEFSNSEDVFVLAAKKLLTETCEDNMLSDDEKKALASFASIFDNPISSEPIEAIAENTFVLTGDFEVPGGKSSMKSAIEAAGGVCKSGVSKKVQYVVVGGLGSDAWAFGNYGSKVKKALDLKLSKGANIGIVTENAFFQYISSSDAKDAAHALATIEEITGRFERQNASTKVVALEFNGLTDGQQSMLDAVKDGKNIYLTGLGGTGKSYILERIIEWANSEDKNVIVCAPTGIAALNIGGTTIHHALGIRPEKTTASNANPWIREDSPLLACDLMIVDEISMCRADLFDYLSPATSSRRLRAKSS